MSNITLRNDLPIPTVKPGAKSPYPFGDMSVGQSFIVEPGEDIKKTVDRMKGTVARWRKRDEANKALKFTVAETKVQDDPMVDPRVVVGVWRNA